MFAVIKTGGKQYRVEKDTVLKIEKIAGEPGSEVVFDEVLMAGDKVGAPLVEGAKVTAEVLGQDRADKIIVFKKKRRQNYRRKKGHKQNITVVKIKAISAS
ncbi:MAG: 50S ribosomal protein L21 [Alphaproteobacteria bacterium]|nr:50S ribosomal protein L21 [Alphaproteobacteria bacterium]